MEQARESGLVLGDTLVLKAFPSTLIMEGEIHCLRGIVVHVYKVLAILRGEGDEAIVETVRYSYNAFVRGYGTFLRHDNAHPHPGHGDAHHRHFGDWRTGKESEPGGWGSRGGQRSVSSSRWSRSGTACTATSCQKVSPGEGRPVIVTDANRFTLGVGEGPDQILRRGSDSNRRVTVLQTVA